MMRELTKREMQVLGYLARHAGEQIVARRVGNIVSAEPGSVNSTIRRLRTMGYVRGYVLTPEGRKMLDPLALLAA